LLARLDVAIGPVKSGRTGFSEKQILIYGGNVDQWKKFANSLKLKMGITIADVDDAKARETIESAVAGASLRPNEDNALLIIPWCSAQYEPNMG
jgi:hypothetical protein